MTATNQNQYTATDTSSLSSCRDPAGYWTHQKASTKDWAPCVLSDTLLWRNSSRSWLFFSEFCWSLSSAPWLTQQPPGSSHRSPNTSVFPTHVISKSFGHNEFPSFPLYFSLLLCLQPPFIESPAWACVCMCLGPHDFLLHSVSRSGGGLLWFNHYAVTEQCVFSRHTVTAARQTSRWVLGKPTGGCQIARHEADEPEKCLFMLYWI